MYLGLIIFGTAAAILIVLAGARRVIRSKNMGYWLPAYFMPPQPAEAADPAKPLHIFIAVCDHWEPQLQGATSAVAMAKVERWASEFPRRYGEFQDSDGRTPQHTFFYPAEEYRPEYLDRIAELCRAGYGDVEIHLHHKDDTADALQAQLEAFKQTLFHRHGLLRQDQKTGEIIYGFIHGNWALCNSRPDGAWCGVDQELSVLLKTGCYADFTMPSAPSPTQTRIINSIYYARDIPGRRKSHDEGIMASVGARAPEDHLLMIQGPLTLDWDQRIKGLMPRIENGDITAGRGMSVRRMKQWLRAAVHVRGQPNWIFVKLHTHGCHDQNINAWLGDEMLQFHRDMRTMADQNPRIRYHYVTAWEMAELVHQAEAGASEPQIHTPAARVSA
ncbi:MAG TPA: hypothetical protein PLD46_01960 [Hyphomicrobium sp.]|nr:hypothetical protein [Hyphomicrobium sp.]